MIETYCEPPKYIPKIQNEELFLMAYKKWAGTNSDCKCEHGEHYSALVVDATSPVCDRHRSWQIYVKTRENMVLTEHEKAYLGLM